MSSESLVENLIYESKFQQNRNGYSNAKNQAKIYFKLLEEEVTIEELAHKIKEKSMEDKAIINIREMIEYFQGYSVRIDLVNYCPFEPYLLDESEKVYSERINTEQLYDETVLNKLRKVWEELDKEGYGKWRFMEDRMKPKFIIKNMNTYINRWIDEFSWLELTHNKEYKKIYSYRFEELKERLYNFKKYNSFIKLNGSGKLKPIIEEILPDKLVHFGVKKSYFDSLSFDNEKNLEELSVWGNSFYEGHPTYLMREELTPNEIALKGFWTSNPEKGVRIIVDTNELLKFRNVFLDPESLSTCYNDEFGKSFFVLGGIPKESIMSIEEYDKKSI